MVAEDEDEDEAEGDGEGAITVKVGNNCIKLTYNDG